jgi:hypothetical protein
LVLGVAGAVWIAEKVFREETQKHHRPQRYFKPLLESAIVETSVIRDVPNFTVRGSIKNTDTSDWDVNEIKVEIVSKGSVVNKCEQIRDFRIVKPGQSFNFLIVCGDIDSPFSGESFEYRVKAFQYDAVNK